MIGTSIFDVYQGHISKARCGMLVSYICCSSDVSFALFSYDQICTNCENCDDVREHFSLCSFRTVVCRLSCVTVIILHCCRMQDVAKNPIIRLKAK